MCLRQSVAPSLKLWEWISARGAIGVLLVATLGAAGCSLAGRTLGGYIDDRSITRSVKRSVAGQRDGALSRVSVDTFGGTVYLTGPVETDEMKSQAETAAWRIKGVTQVVNDVRVRRAARTPSIVGPARPALLDRLHGIARVDPGLPNRPDEAYDANGRLVASVYRLTLRELAQSGFDERHPLSRPIDHVSIVAIAPHGDVPDEEYYLVLWHVSRAEAAALK